MNPTNKQILESLKQIILSPEAPAIEDMPPFLFLLQSIRIEEGGEKGLMFKSPEEIKVELPEWGDVVRPHLNKGAGFLLVAVVMEDENEDSESIIIAIHRNIGEGTLESYRYDLKDFKKNENPRDLGFDIRDVCPTFGVQYH